MRVLHVVGRMERGGIQAWVLHLLKSEGRRFEADLLVHTSAPCEHDEEVRSLGVKVIPFGRGEILRYAFDLGRVLRAEGPYDVVHCHLPSFSGWVLLAASRAGVPVRVAHSHNDYNRLNAISRCNHRYIHGLRLALMKRLVDRHATLGLAASREAAASLFGPGWQADPRWRVLHYGIDTAPFRDDRPDRAAVRAELGLPADAFVVGHVGRFAPQKNHRFLIDVAAELARRRPGFRLLLVGEGALRPAVERWVAELGLGDRVVFAGSRPDVPRLMRGAMDVLVLPSFSEGLPLVGIEAQAAGLVAVVSDVVTPELDLVPGLVRRVSLGEPASAWAEALLGVGAGGRAADPWEALRAVERSSFSIRASVEGLEHAYGISGAG